MNDLIIKNTDTVAHTWGGIVIPSSSSYTIQEVDRIRLLSDPIFLTDLENEDAVINNGTNDLVPNQGLLYLNKELNLIHGSIPFSPGLGVLAPEVVNIGTGPAFGHLFNIGDEVFALTYFNNFVSHDVSLQLFLAIDNSSTDKWVQFECTILATSGDLDVSLDGFDTIEDADPVEVPDTPYLVFSSVVTIPASIFDNGKTGMFVRIKRITPAGKTAPTNHPILIRMDKLYKQRLGGQ